MPPTPDDMLTAVGEVDAEIVQLLRVAYEQNA